LAACLCRAFGGYYGQPKAYGLVICPSKQSYISSEQFTSSVNIIHLHDFLLPLLLLSLCAKARDDQRQVKKALRDM
jgi:hypothetical protein